MHHGFLARAAGDTLVSGHIKRFRVVSAPARDKPTRLRRHTDFISATAVLSVSGCTIELSGVPYVRSHVTIPGRKVVSRHAVAILVHGDLF